MDIEKIQKGYVKYLQEIVGLDKETSINYLFQMTDIDIHVIEYMDYTKTSIFESKDSSYFLALGKYIKTMLKGDEKEIEKIVDPLKEYAAYAIELDDEFDYANYGKKDEEIREEVLRYKNTIVFYIERFIKENQEMRNKYQFVYDYENGGFKDMTDETISRHSATEDFNPHLECALSHEYDVKASFNNRGQLFIHLKYNTDKIFDFFEVIK